MHLGSSFSPSHRCKRMTYDPAVAKIIRVFDSCVVRVFRKHLVKSIRARQADWSDSVVFLFVIVSGIEDIAFSSSPSFAPCGPFCAHCGVTTFGISPTFDLACSVDRDQQSKLPLHARDTYPSSSCIARTAYAFQICAGENRPSQTKIGYIDEGA